MATVTLHLDEDLMKAAEEMARENRLTVDGLIVDVFQRAAADRQRSGLSDAEIRHEGLQRFDAAMSRLAHFDTGGPYSRDEMNER